MKPSFQASRQPPQLRLSRAALRCRKAKNRQFGETAATPYTVTSSQNDDLVAKLKAYRLQTSRAEKVQAYVVFNDRQLEDLITRKPRTLADLRQISGFGPVKAEKYGPRAFWPY